MPHLYSSKQTFSHCDQTACCSQLTVKLFSRQHLACLFEQLQIFVELEGVSFGVGASFLLGTLLVHDHVQLTSLWTVTLVFQQFPGYGSWVVPDYPKFCLI